MTAMTLKQQNELTLKKIELQMIEDYFSKESRDSRKQHGQKSSGQMKAVLRKYDFEKWLWVTFDDSMTKEFKEALNTLWTYNLPFSFKAVKDSEGQPEFTWKIAGQDNLYEI
jgi:hypothetical protein